MAYDSEQGVSRPLIGGGRSLERSRGDNHVAQAWEHISSPAGRLQLLLSGVVGFASALLCSFVIFVVSRAVAGLPFYHPPTPGLPATGLAGFTKSICRDEDWRKISLKTIDMMPIAGILSDLRGRGKFEASGITSARGLYWVAFDGMEAFGVVDEHMQFRDATSKLVGHIGDASQYEGITYRERTDTFFVTVEAVPVEQGRANQALVAAGQAPGRQLYSPQIHEVDISTEKESAVILKQCTTDFYMYEANKGFEAVEFFEHMDGTDYFIGLCEGNNCKGLDTESGHGTLVILKQEDMPDAADGNDCLLKVVKTVKLPGRADFMDYAALDFYPLPIDGNPRDGVGRLVVGSQENAAIWVGDFDQNTLEIIGEGVMLHYPRDKDCEIMHCNVEGLVWVDEYRLIAVSDRAKARQPHWCTSTDQSMIMFMLPSGFDKLEDPTAQ